MTSCKRLSSGIACARRSSISSTGLNSQGDQDCLAAVPEIHAITRARNVAARLVTQRQKLCSRATLLGARTAAVCVLRSIVCAQSFLRNCVARLNQDLNNLAFIRRCARPRIQCRISNESFLLHEFQCCKMHYKYLFNIGVGHETNDVPETEAADGRISLHCHRLFVLCTS